MDSGAKTNRKYWGGNHTQLKGETLYIRKMGPLDVDSDIIVLIVFVAFY